MYISLETSLEINLQITLLIQSSLINKQFDIDAYQPEVEARAKLEITSGIESGVESEIGTKSKPIIVVVQFSDLMIQKAQKATQNARAKMAQKYSKKHNIQHFGIRDIVSLKVLREDRTSIDNKRLFGQILEEPYFHRYKVLTCSGIIKHLIPTKELGVVAKVLWSDIKIPKTTKEVILGLATREASTSTRVRILCQYKGPCNTKKYKCYKESKQCSVHCHRDDNECGNLLGLVTRTEIALVDRPRRKRAKANTAGSSVQINSIHSYSYTVNLLYSRVV